MRIVIGIVAGIVVLAVAVLAFARVLFDRRIDHEMAALAADAEPGEAAIVTDDDLAGLPEPVARWLRNSGVVGRPPIAGVRLRQEGEFQLGPGRGWVPFVADQVATTEPPAFVWSVRMAVGPGVSIRGRDRYANRTGDMDMRLLSLVPLASSSGGGLNQGALLRWLGEMGWYPSAAVGPYVDWEPIDERSARATVRDGDVTASAVFVFDDAGRPVEVRADRFSADRGTMARWQAPNHAFGVFDDLRVPVEAEAVWDYPDGAYPYIRLRVTAFAASPADSQGT